MSEWQPIETAPKDGMRVLVIGKSGYVDAGHYIEGWGWEDANGNIMKPTHWMPLPEPPK